MKKIRNNVIITVMSLALGLSLTACGEQVRLETGKETARQEEQKTETGETTGESEAASQTEAQIVVHV